MKKTLVTLAAGVCLLASCSRSEYLPVKEEPCINQTENPAGRSYSSDSTVRFLCTEKHCGLLPLSRDNYWIYEDSIFDNGVFVKVQFDTLRYSNNLRSTTDNLVWWQSDLFVGLPQTLFSNDSAIYALGDRLFMPGIKDVKKEYSLFTGDSLRYLTSFEDAAASGRALKYQQALETPAGRFSDCIYYEKNARFYRRDQVIFKPGIGVVKFISEEAPMGTPMVRLQRIATLVKYVIR